MTDMRVPIILGVTGHRDIPNEDWDVISEKIRHHFLHLKHQYPNSPFRLISGLAEGADRLVAEVALEAEIGFTLLAALPMDQVDYEKDFQTPASLAHFHHLIKRADKSFVVESTDAGIDNEPTRDEKYLALGRYIARHTQIVIALWDGVSEQSTPDGKSKIPIGGTADVVRLCRSGQHSDDDLLVLPEITHVDHFYVRRMHQKITPNQFQTFQIGELVHLEGEVNAQSQVIALLRSINRFNAFAHLLPSSELNTSRGYILGCNAPSVVTENLAIPIAIFSAADAAAISRQKEKSSAIKWVSVLALASIICQQIYSGPDMRWGWLAGHIGLAILAFIAFLYFFKGTHPREEQYLDWRALAEGLRVQIFWLAAGVNASVAEHYLSIDRGDLDWIRQAVRNSATGLESLESREAMGWVRNSWLIGQGEFFTKAAPKNKCKYEHFSKLTNRFFIAALIITLTTLLVHLTSASDLILNGLVLASGICFLLSAVIKTYADQMAFEEQHNRYKGMSQTFTMALERYDALVVRNNNTQARGVLFNIGKDALAENAGWLRLHRQRQYEVNVG